MPFMRIGEPVAPATSEPSTRWGRGLEMGRLGRQWQIFVQA
jgi:hypothetical protein